MRPLPLALLSLLPLAGCLENEEHVVVRADGSVEVTVRSKGRLADLAGGYPVPLHGPWVPANRASELWLERVGPATGGHGALDRALAIAWRSFGVDPGADELELAARARFSSVADWPLSFAPPDEPYRAASLERAAELRVELRGAYRVYSFERTYRGRSRARHDAFHVLFERAEGFPAELRAKLDADEPLTLDETRFVASEVAAAFRDVYGVFAEEALAPEGDDAIPAPVRARIARACRERVARSLGEARVARLLEELRADGGGEIDAAEELEREARDELRAALAEELVAAGLEQGLRHAALWRLEFGFSFADATTDLSDESFTVIVELPGTIVTGNYDELRDGAAVWRFDFEDIASADRVLRAASVVE